MTYMGSKSKYVKDIAPIINNYIVQNNITDFYDVFCGGANLTYKIKCKNLYANDLSPTLIALHKQMQQDPSLIPTTGSREWWDEAKAEYQRLMANSVDITKWEQGTKIPLWKIGAIEWYSSYVRGGFPRGYAKATDKRDYFNEAYRNHKKQSESPEYQKIIFTQGDYKKIKIPENALIYCDSPYKGTKPYGINPKFDFDEYYDWLREKSKTNPIFISEQEMPDDFELVWQKQTNRTTKLDNKFKAVEKLFFIDNREVKM